MSRYFFDLVGQDRSQYDYSGHDFPSPEQAYQLADLIAMDLAVEEQEPWYGWAVKVRNIQGSEVFSVPVHSGYLAAA